MLFLELHRSGLPLSTSERSALPEGADAVAGDERVIARMDVGGLTRIDQLHAAVALARAVPDAVFVVRDEPLEGELPEDPWAAIEAGHLEGVDQALVGAKLSSDQRWRVQQLLRSAHPEETALGCRIARVVGWRSAVTHIRRLVDHEDADVRRACADALGVLAGPVVTPLLQRLARDESPEVREAASGALETIESR